MIAVRCHCRWRHINDPPLAALIAIRVASGSLITHAAYCYTYSAGTRVCCLPASNVELTEWRDGGVGGAQYACARHRAPSRASSQPRCLSGAAGRPVDLQGARKHSLTPNEPSFIENINHYQHYILDPYLFFFYQFLPFLIMLFSYIVYLAKNGTYLDFSFVWFIIIRTECVISVE